MVGREVSLALEDRQEQQQQQQQQDDNTGMGHGRRTKIRGSPLSVRRVFGYYKTNKGQKYQVSPPHYVLQLEKLLEKVEEQMKREEWLGTKPKAPQTGRGSPMLKIIFWNIQGFNSLNKQQEVRRLPREEKPNIFILLETKVKEHNANELVRKCFGKWSCICNYEHHYNDRIWLFYKEEETVLL